MLPSDRDEFRKALRALKNNTFPTHDDILSVAQWAFLAREQSTWRELLDIASERDAVKRRQEIERIAKTYGI